MKIRFSLLALFLFLHHVQAEPVLKEIRTASDRVLVAFFTSDTIWADEVNTADAILWKLNGRPVEAISKFVTEADLCNHHIYLQMPGLKIGQRYHLETPYGDTLFVFDDKQMLCESIKVNQVGYSALSKVRYANLAIWLGDGGVRTIKGTLPEYEVFELSSGKEVCRGRLTETGSDNSSGDYVYRIDLSTVPEGGPYRVRVIGYGSSYPFGVGANFSKRLGYVSFRSLYYQRCGIPIQEPFGWNIRKEACHTTIYRTDAPIGEANLVVKGDEPTFTAWGGYHDAGDADRRTYHMDVTATLLTTYEAFPHLFTDNQFQIPDIFDEQFRILGQGNGIPDVIDEAEWGAMFWLYMQDSTGQIHWGTETKGYSPFTTYDFEDHKFGTQVKDLRSASFAAGLFMHMARMLKPYKPQRSEEFRKHAEMAYAAAGSSIRPSHHLYYAVQKYLLSGNEADHQKVRELADGAARYVETYNGAPESFASTGWLASFFYSYIADSTRPKDPAVTEKFKAALKAAADKQISILQQHAYPVGTPTNHRWWGSNVAQGQYAYPCLLYWALTGQQPYIDAVSQLMDYALGLNPIGKCYMTGLGFNRVHNPHDRESAYTKKMGWGPREGILVFGPGGSGNGTSVPAVTGLPRERRYIDNLASIQWSEFTIYQSLCFPSVLYPVLGGGGKWNPSVDPYEQ